MMVVEVVVVVVVIGVGVHVVGCGAWHSLSFHLSIFVVLFEQRIFFNQNVEHEKLSRK